MAETPYQRVTSQEIEQQLSDHAEAVGADESLAQEGGMAVRLGIRLLLVLPLSLLLCILQAVLTIYAANVRGRLLTSTLIPVLAFGVLFLLVLLVNPLVKLIFRNVIRPLARAELMCVFAAMLVTAGISTFGLTAQLVPLVAAPWNPEWNTPQRGWSEHVLPNLNPDIYLSVPDAAPDEQRDAALSALSAIDAAEGGDLHAAVNTLRTLVANAQMPNEVPGVDRSLRLVRGAWPTGPTVMPADRFAEVVEVSEANAQALRHVRDFREGVNVPAPPPSTTFTGRIDYYLEVFTSISWSAWVKPIGYWLIFIFAIYGLFYSLTYIVLGYWSQREKLIFPLAKLGESLLPESDDKRRWIPGIFQTSGFWIGFAFVFAIMSWNAAAGAGWLPGLGTIKLGMGHFNVTPELRGTVFEGLTGSWHALMFLIIFTAIGIAFLLPLEISFSVWFYFLIGKLVLLVMIWFGYGQTTSDFPADWLWRSNPITAQGAGGIILFSAISLYRCLSEYFRLAFGEKRQLKQRLMLLLPVIGFGVCVVIVVAWICWNWNAAAAAEQTASAQVMRTIWALLIVAFITLLTLGLMRIVAEGGIYWFQASGASVFHQYKMLGIGGWGGMALKTALVGPLLLIYSIFFLDLKTFLAPNLLNAGKMNEDAGKGRGKFHAIIITCLVVTVVVSLGFAIYLAHMRGAQQMHGWFYSAAPAQFLDTAYRATTDTPEFEPGTLAWTGLGGFWVGLTMFLRRSLFWWPHPIGYIMLINPLMAQLWFSFFLGWICKKFVVKYGGKTTFDRVRTIFIGLILGELMCMVFWMALSMSLGVNAWGYDLNRYGP